MKVAIITDQHFGARKNSKLFHDYFLKFYNDVFFPTIEEQNISTVIDLGDTFDSRKGIDFSSLAWAKNNYYDKLKNLGCQVITVVGNHTAYYKNTNNINAVDLLLREYENVSVISDPEERSLGNLKVLFVPWICSDNEERTFKMIQKTKASVAMGHLELNGFNAYKGHTMNDGMDAKVFDKFTKVFSGHYHTRSNDGKIFYLGNPYEIYWNDVNDTRGFHIFDTETLEHLPINNPHQIFKNIYYEDTDYRLFDVRDYVQKIVKIIVRKKSDIKLFEHFIDKVYSANVAELKIVENFQYENLEEFEAFESEDTITILNRYIEESDISMDKSIIRGLIQEIYQQACEIV